MAAIDELNSLLQSMAEANDGCNHGSDYSFYELPDAESLPDALGEYFSAMSTSYSPAASAQEWQISTAPFPRESIRSAANHWFYELRYSPTVESVVAEKTLDKFIALLRGITTTTDVFEVQIVPPMWYECLWQDFAFDDDGKHWFLHFGFSD